MPNWSIPFITNSKKGSIKTIQHRKLNFNDLWAAYPKDGIAHPNPETKEPLFKNQCAIRVSHALYVCGIKLKAYHGVKCWGCTTPNEQGKGIHAIRAQELADYLKKRPFAGCPHAEQFSGSNFAARIEGRTGIIFFKDYWQRGNETGRTGDHIDLWNGSSFGHDGLFLSWARAFHGEVTEHLTFGSVSNLERSSEVLFWVIP